jgi:hypothetical protein
MATTRKKETALTVDVALTADEKENKQLAVGRQTKYTVPEGEQADTVHVEVEKTTFSSNPYRKTSKPQVLKFNTRTWLKMEKELATMGYDHIRVLYNPADKK